MVDVVRESPRSPIPGGALLAHTRRKPSSSNTRANSTVSKTTALKPRCKGIGDTAELANGIDSEQSCFPLRRVFGLLRGGFEIFRKWSASLFDLVSCFFDRQFPVDGFGNPIDVAFCVASMDLFGHSIDESRNVGKALLELCENGTDSVKVEHAISDLKVGLPLLETYVQGAGPIVHNQICGRQIWKAVASPLRTCFGDLTTVDERRRLSNKLRLGFHPDKRPGIRGSKDEHPGVWSARDWDSVWDFIKVASVALRSPDWPAA